MQNKSFIIAALILVATTVAVLAIDSRKDPVVIATNLENIPMDIAGFSGSDDFFSQFVYDELNADLNVYRHYTSKEGNQIDLYIGYYGTAKGGRTPHNPYACFPSSGWAIVGERGVTLNPRGYAQGVDVKFLHVKKDGVHNIVFHWYQSAGNKVLATGFQQNIQRLKGRIFYNRNDGAFIRISTLASEEENVDEAFDIVRSFSNQVLSLLPQYWPVEKDL